MENKEENFSSIEDPRQATDADHYQNHDQENQEEVHPQSVRYEKSQNERPQSDNFAS